MPTTQNGGAPRLTPEETTVVLLEQGYTVEEIVAEAERNIADAEAGIEYVNAAAGNAAAPKHLTAKEAARAALDELPANASEKEVHAALFYAEQDHLIVSTEHRDAQRAAEQHRKHAGETITNAKRRIAAAQDAGVAGPAVERFKALKKAEAAALKKAESA